MPYSDGSPAPNDWIRMASGLEPINFGPPPSAAPAPIPAPGGGQMMQNTIFPNAGGLQAAPPPSQSGVAGGSGQFQPTPQGYQTGNTMTTLSGGGMTSMPLPPSSYPTMNVGLPGQVPTSGANQPMSGQGPQMGPTAPANMVQVSGPSSGVNMGQGTMTAAPTGYQTGNTMMSTGGGQLPTSVGYQPGLQPGMDPWASRNLAAQAGNPWGYQYDPRFQQGFSYNQRMDYDDYVRDMTGTQRQIRTAQPGGQSVVGGMTGQNFATMQPVTPQGQAQAQQNAQVLQQAPTPPPVQTPSATPAPTERSTPGGASVSGDQGRGGQTQGLMPGVQGNQQAMAGVNPQMNSMQSIQQAQQAYQQAIQQALGQFQQSGYGVPFSQSYLPPQAFSGINPYQQATGNMGMSSLPAGAFATNMWNPGASFGGYGQQFSDGGGGIPDLTSLLLQLLGGGGF